MGADYATGRPSLEGNMSGGGGGGGGVGGQGGSGQGIDRSLMNAQMGFWSAFGTGGFPDEPGLMEGESRLVYLWKIVALN